MGEDMWIEYESSSDEDDDSSDEDDDSDDDDDDEDDSDQEDDFLSLPLDDRRSFRR